MQPFWGLSARRATRILSHFPNGTACQLERTWNPQSGRIVTERWCHLHGWEPQPSPYTAAGSLQGGWTPFQHLPSLTATFLGCWGQPTGPGLGLRQSLHRPAERRAASTIPFSFCSPKLRGSSGATVLGLAPSSPTMGAAVVSPTYPANTLSLATTGQEQPSWIRRSSLL